MNTIDVTPLSGVVSSATQLCQSVSPDVAAISCVVLIVIIVGPLSWVAAYGLYRYTKAVFRGC